MGRISGIDEIRLRYSESFVVETSVDLADGKPMAYKIKPLKPMALFAMGFTWPMKGNGKPEETLDAQEEAKVIDGIMKVVARSIVAAREVEEGEDGAWKERWTPVEVVCNRPPNPKAEVRELGVDEIDYADTITRCWDAMLHRFQLQSGGGGAGDRRPRAKGTRKPRRAGGKVG